MNKVVNVPLHDNDIVSTISKLPRSPDDAALLNVAFKRKQEYKTKHMHAFITANAPYKAVEKLKEMGT